MVEQSPRCYGSLMLHRLTVVYLCTHAGKFGNLCLLMEVITWIIAPSLEIKLLADFGVCFSVWSVGSQFTNLAYKGSYTMWMTPSTQALMINLLFIIHTSAQSLMTKPNSYAYWIILAFCMM